MNALLKLLISRGAGARLVPPGPATFQAELPAVDPEEEVVDVDYDDDASDERVDHIIGESLVIRYLNGAGEYSRRRIALHCAYERDGIHYLRAFCYERAAPRLFRSDRIIEIVDAQSGEIIDGLGAILEAVADRANPLDSREATERAFMLHRQGIVVLLFLARCDGVHPSEEEVLLQYLDDGCGTKGVDEDSALSRLRRMHPDPLSYEKAVRYLNRFRPEELSRVARFARRLVDADGAISEEEALFAAALDQCRLR